MSNSADVIIVGGGIIGMASALELERRGFEVLVIDRGEFGQEASSADAGLLAPHTEATGNEALDSFCVASNLLYPDFVSAIKEETGIDPEFRTEGTLLLALDETEQEALEERAARYRAGGVEFRFLSAAEVREAEPSVAGTARAALHIQADRLVDNWILVQALRRALELRGISARTYTAVTDILHGAHGAWYVQANTDVFISSKVVMAAGAWSGNLAAPGAWSGNLAAPCAVSIPVSPVRGQIVCLHAAPETLNHCIVTSRCYLVPRLDSRVLVGSTMEHAGFEKAVTARGMHHLLESAFAAVPSLRDSAFLAAWSGLRPDSADHLPIIGAGPTAGWITATGHFRNGILLAPATARIVGDLASGDPPFLSIDAFDPARFQC